MFVLDECHKSLDNNGKGKCSVVVHIGGYPAGFCNKTAYGLPLTGEHFCNGLACPQHGGPLAPRDPNFASKLRAIAEEAEEADRIKREAVRIKQETEERERRAKLLKELPYYVEDIKKRCSNNPKARILVCYFERMNTCAILIEELKEELRKEGLIVSSSYISDILGPRVKLEVKW